MIGGWEIFMILLVVLLVFGTSRLPNMMGDLAKGIKTFKQGLKDEDAAQKDQTEEQKRLTHQNEDASSEKETSTHHRT